MATLTRVKVKNQSCGRMLGALAYVLQDKKVRCEGMRIESGVNCLPRTGYTEMMTTKQAFKKTDGNCFLHYVQSFLEDENLTPWQANEIARELAEKLFPGYECVVATHTDTDNLHSHIIVNSVSFQSGKKLHLGPDSLREQRLVNDKICLAHGLTILEPFAKQKRKKRFTPGEYRAAERGESWKFRLIKAIEEALLYSNSKQLFVENMEYEGYEVRWDNTHKYILFTTPEGKNCRDSTLHDDTYLKENLEKLFAFRQATNWMPQTPEPPEGWLAEMTAVADLVRLGKDMENLSDIPLPQKTYTQSENKLKRREALKQLAQGHKLESEQGQDYSQTM